MQMDTPDIVVIHGDLAPGKIKKRLQRKKLRSEVLVLAYIVEKKV